MLDLTDFIKEYVAQLHREKEAIIRVICGQIIAQLVYTEVKEKHSAYCTRIDESCNYQRETWKDDDLVYDFFFKRGEVYTVNIYESWKYEV